MMCPGARRKQPFCKRRSMCVSLVLPAGLGELPLEVELGSAEVLNLGMGGVEPGGDLGASSPLLLHVRAGSVHPTLAYCLRTCAPPAGPVVPLGALDRSVDGEVFEGGRWLEVKEESDE